jgi:hypothetical protein
MVPRTAALRAFALVHRGALGRVGEHPIPELQPLTAWVWCRTPGRDCSDVADRTTLIAELSEAVVGLRKPRARHDPGRVLVDMAVAVADGARTISDVAVLADQAALFGAVASGSTCWRLLERLDTARLGAVASARAAAREVVWAQRAELCRQPFPPARAAGRDLPGLVIDLDASIVVCHRTGIGTGSRSADAL